jgi:hypothetical protein
MVCNARMNEITLAGAIRSCVIVAIDLEVFLISGRNLQEERNKMSLGLDKVSLPFSASGFRQRGSDAR